MRFSKRQLILVLLLVCIPAAAAVLSRSSLADRFRSDGPMELKVNLSERTLSVIEDGEVVQTYGVAIGTPSHPTPTGSFRTGTIDWNPRWVPPNSEWARGEQAREPGDPANPMQGVKIHFSPLYFIHGTNDPESIGSAASHGCLRMRTGDATDLARRIEEYGSVPLTIEG